LEPTGAIADVPLGDVLDRDLVAARAVSAGVGVTSVLIFGHAPPLDVIEDRAWGTNLAGVDGILFRVRWWVHLRRRRCLRAVFGSAGGGLCCDV